MMKLPIVERLQTMKTGEVEDLTPHLTARVDIETVDPAMAPMSRSVYKVRTGCTFQMDQWANEGRELAVLKERAIRVMVHEIYGPVTDRLLEILGMLWEAGPIYDDKVGEAIEQLLRDLEP
jgi:hypothetical protein